MEKSQNIMKRIVCISFFFFCAFIHNYSGQEQSYLGKNFLCLSKNALKQAEIFLIAHFNLSEKIGKAVIK